MLNLLNLLYYERWTDKRKYFYQYFGVSFQTTIRPQFSKLNNKTNLQWCLEMYFKTLNEQNVHIMDDKLTENAIRGRVPDLIRAPQAWYYSLHEDLNLISWAIGMIFQLECVVIRSNNKDSGIISNLRSRQSIVVRLLQIG